jgi:hypothetical protein
MLEMGDISDAASGGLQRRLAVSIGVLIATRDLAGEQGPVGG